MYIHIVYMYVTYTNKNLLLNSAWSRVENIIYKCILQIQYLFGYSYSSIVDISFHIPYWTQVLLYLSIFNINLTFYFIVGGFLTSVRTIHIIANIIVNIQGPQDYRT